jgi:hypothetical protein
MNLKHNVRSVAKQFQVYGEFLSAAPYGSGHINDTYCVVFDQSGTRVRYIFQRINHNIFKKPILLMENIQRVTSHLAAKMAGELDFSRRLLSLIPSRDGLCYYQDGQGNYWRAYLFIEKARSYDTVEVPKQAFEAAKAYGNFQKLLADLPTPTLHETIPDFHHTPKRFAALMQAVEADVEDRAILAKSEIDFAMQHASITDVLVKAKLPHRVTHNDTKFNNVMLDDVTGEGICVVDLDTLMSGLTLYDFGDMVRTTTSLAKEDERDLSLVKVQLPMFEALLRGYLTAATDFLTPPEKGLLAFSGKLITFEIGIRFLTDFLQGDTYFKVHRDGHNLDRCRAQFKLVQSIEQQEEQMQTMVEFISRGEEPVGALTEEFR